VRRLAAAVGVAAATFGLAVVSGALPRPFGLDDAFVLLVGALAVVQGLRYGLARRGVEYEATEFGDPELRYRVPAPGDDDDEYLTGSGGVGYRARQRRREFRDRLRELAAETVALRENCSEADATDLIDEGVWTDDPYAAHFLSRGSVPIPLHLRARAALSRVSSFRFYVDRSVAAIDAAREVSE